MWYLCPHEKRLFKTSQVRIGDDKILDQITFDPGIMGGRACIRGMRITVSLVVNLIANGMTVDKILREYPRLEAEDIRQALQYAASLAADEVHPLSIGG